MSQIPVRDELDALEAQDSFIGRHIAPDAAGIASMLETVGVASLEALAARTVPDGIRIGDIAGLPVPADETAALAELRGLAEQNVVARSLIGAGYHGTRTPPVILRNVLENPGWYTAYTPYQAEIAQGRLEALLNFQTLVTELTGLPVANASLLDEATAAAEAVAMARAATKVKAGGTVALSRDLHPQTASVIATRMEPIGAALVQFAPGDTGAIAAAKPFAVVLNYPGTSGEVRDLRAEIDAAHAAGALAIVCADPLALVLLTPPGELGADVVVGSSQRFGVPMGFGGPHAAFFATAEAHRRLMPGRIVGVSIDAAGAPAMRLALQTREQHIRREKATSNICTAQVLLAVIAGFYAVWHGPEGLRRIARRVNLHARLLAQAARAGGHALVHAEFFDTITLVANPANQELYDAAGAAGFNLHLHADHTLSISLDETVTRHELATLCGLLADESTTLDALLGGALADTAASLPASLLRAEEGFLGQAVFNTHRSEHAMLRYLKRLEDKDVALNRSMIPLGSCTMKLNATAEMIPVTWPEFSDIHPYAPTAQTAGYLTLIERLSGWLAAATGFAAVSLQPNAGSQGEYAGLLAIRAWHHANGGAERDICLIPASAHGTNPASAAMAGMRVVVVACTREGDVDVADLEAKVVEHGAKLSTLMITYPSTHGVFEEQIRRICTLVHEHGGQVYMDGANMNAQLGLTSPGEIGADVCHLNLHKTFCIPHGGGGPGIGPIGVAAHLVPYLPGHPAVVTDGLADPAKVSAVGPVSAAPYGSAMILPISYAYIRMMGARGLKRASEVAILSANYIATRLAPHYPVLYKGARGMVAHECIIDCRGFEASANVRVEDIAKRLQDYGFHAPTMSWPVPGTLMIEPTESEPKDEIDRFCDAMIAIRAEITAIEAGDADRIDNVLRNAPHTEAELTGAWSHPYSRAAAVFPLPFVRVAKYWPPVKRVDNAYGDRNLVCTCAPLEAYAEAAE